MRFIDADELKRAFYCAFPLGALSTEGAIQTIDETPTVMQWVGVEEDGLPKTPEHVLCYSLEHGRIVGSYYPIGKYFITAMDGRLRDVTHWMPLPPPPRK